MANGISSNIITDAADPIQFLKLNADRNLVRKNAGLPAEDEAKLPANGQVFTPPKQPENELPSENTYVPQLPPEKQAAPAKETAPEQPKETEPDYPVDIPEPEAPIDAKSPEVNLKKLRAKLNETKTVLTQKDSEIEKLNKRIEAFETGLEYPEAIQAREAKIAELERYKTIHDFKNSDEYQEKFVKPQTELSEKIKEYGKEYGIPEQEMERALSLTSVAELNRFLSDRFDDVGALEVKNLVTSLQQVRKGMTEAEKAPKETFDRLRQEREQFLQVQDSERRNVITNSAKSGWKKALTKIQTEGKLKDLVISPDNKEHNETRAKPLLQAAATEYGRIVRELGELGLKQLPEELALALANMTQMALASALINEERNAAVSKLNELSENTRRSSGFNRPSYSGSGKETIANDSSSKPRTSEQAAQDILKKVLPSF